MDAGESMEAGKGQGDGVQWMPWSVIECSGFHAAWQNASRLNAEDSMHCGVMDPDCMQRSPCSVKKWNILNAVDSMQREEIEPYCKQSIICSMIECSRLHAASLNAVDFLQHGPKHPD